MISILLPLGVGTASVCELMDFSLTAPLDPAALPERLTAALPEGIRATAVYPGGRKVRELKWLLVEGVLEYDAGDPAALCAPLSAFFRQASIVIRKKTKRGEGESDIAPAIRELSLTPGDRCVHLQGVISAQDPTLNPELLPNALRQLAPALAPDFASFTRLEVYDAEMQPFR